MAQIATIKNIYT